MKRILFAATVILTTLISSTSFAAPGLLFNVGPTTNPATVKITLCLNAKGPISCQNYNVSPSSLTLRTTIPNHTYPNAGIKINTPGFSLANIGLNCTPISNGYCAFSVSDTKPITINLSTDYIVVGVGTAGAVLAKTLSDDKQTSVVALHNGSNYDQNPLITLTKNTILTVLSALVGPPLYTDSETTPQTNANNRNLLWVYALPLGGASAVNAGTWARGTNENYALWEATAGPNWSVQTIQNTLIGLENYTGQTTDPQFRGYNGPLPIRQVPISNITLLAKKFNQAIINATGESEVLDYNDPETPIGPSLQMQYTQMGSNGALRSSSSITFLNSKVMQPDGSGVNGRTLQVMYNTTANNIIWNGNKAVGVRYYQNGNTFSLYANKGVIVAAGIKSSAFLMRSGVGPGALLRSLNIPVVYDNPNVGSGLADQPHVVLIYTSNPDDSMSTATLTIFGDIITALAQTALGRELINLIGNSVDVNNGLFSQIAWLPSPTGDQSIRALRYVTFNPIPGITVALFDLVQPASRGSIAITSSDPFVEPSIDLGVLNNPADLNLYVSGFQVYIKNINDQLQIIDPAYTMVYPNPNLLDVANETDLINFIREEVGSDMHFQSHCRMASLADGGVVDSTGHVYGVQNLIVADDSVAPVPTDGSPMATAYLIASNIARMILAR